MGQTIHNVQFWNVSFLKNFYLIKKHVILHNHFVASYNNEWMIVDYNKFTPGMPLNNGLLTVLDQIPGTVTWSDQTNLLRSQKYFASYNIP